ncbi:MAG: NADPH:quinone reductase [Chthoniobacteraceae bacterium]
MKAIRVEQFGDPGVMKLAELPDLRPTGNQILVRLHAAGVNPVETYIRSGNYAAKPALPYTPGSDGAGVVEQSGGGFSKGDRVFLAGSLTGTYAELALANPGQVFHLPDGVSFEAGAALGVPYGTAHRALFERGQAQAGETVLVHGASGGVGTAAVQLAHAAGLRVFGTASTEEGRRLVRESGADEVFDHRAPGDLEAMLAATGGRGVNLILEMLANVNLGKDLTLLAQRGRVVVIGSRGPVEINPRDLMARDADVRGLMLGHAPEAERAHIYSEIAAGLATGSLKPQIGQTFPLAQAPEAHRAIMESSAAGKIVLKIGD